MYDAGATKLYSTLVPMVTIRQNLASSKRHHVSHSDYIDAGKQISCRHKPDFL